MLMKKILGLDIGTTSIGWAIVEAADDNKIDQKTGKTTVSHINNERLGIHNSAVGVRIIPQNSDNVKSFIEGKRLIQKNTTTPTAKRRFARGSRRMKNRYKLRRDKLVRVLNMLSMLPDGSHQYNDKANRWEVVTGEQGKWFTKLKEFEITENGREKRKRRANDIGEALYKLRTDSINNAIDLKDWGRILLHLNQWRGYSSDRFKRGDENETDNDFYTSMVISVNKKEEIYKGKANPKKGKANPKVDKIIFEVTFENGDVGNDIVPFGENSYSRFKKDEFATYKKEIDEKDDGTKDVILKWQKLKEDDWTYRKWKVNKGVDNYINGDKANRTVGSYFYNFFYEAGTPKSERIDRIRNNVVNRDWYEDEFDKIWNFQFERHKDHLERIDIENVVKTAFKDYQSILKEVSKRQGIREQLRYLIKDKIIYYQRPWQQAKNKGECLFEYVPDVKKEKDGSFVPNTSGKRVIDKNGKEIYLKGRTVIPRSHPLFQEYKIWQQINNVRIYLNTYDEKIDLVNKPDLFFKLFNKNIVDTKQNLFNELNYAKTVSWRVFCRESLDIKDYLVDDEKDLKKEYYKYCNEETGEIQDAYFTINFRKKKRNGQVDDIKLKGNTTQATLHSVLVDKDKGWFYEIHSEKQKISNLQLLWEIIYDITNTKTDDVSKIIGKHFGFDKSICNNLASVNFDDAGMGNLSAKAIRQLLPLMSDGSNLTEKTGERIQSIIALNNSIEENAKGDDEKLESVKNFVSDKKARLRLSKLTKPEDFKYLNYWEAAAVVYGSHTTKKTNTQPEISRVKQHSMNNPVVEKIVNETISVVNEIYKTYGFDEVRLELSRELKASMDERQQMWEAMQTGYEKNEWAKKMLRELKSALKSDNRDIENIDAEPSIRSNVDKIKIIEDVVKYQKREEYKKKEKEFKQPEPSKAEIIKYLLWLEQNFKCPYTNQPIPLTDVFAMGKVVEIEHIIPKERYYSNAYSNKVITWREVNRRKGNKTAFEFIDSKRDVDDTINISNTGQPKTVKLIASSDWKEHIESMFPKGAKRNNLLRKEIPEDPIDRTLKETQYINKKLRDKLAELVGESKVWVSSGAVTDILREKWHLNDLLKELIRERFENFNIGENKENISLIRRTNEYSNKTEKYEDVEKWSGYSKRVDHRHHALDAIIIACTKQNHIQYINELNSINTVDQEDDDAKKAKYEALKTEVCEGSSSTKFTTPWKKDNFIPTVKNCLDKIIVSQKNTRPLISPSKHRVGKEIKTGKVASIRGELHKETNYAKKKYFTGDHLAIDKLIALLLKKKLKNQLQTMVLPKSFLKIIKETVLKEKYQSVLLPLFKKYDDLRLNDKTGKNADAMSISTIHNIILKEIKSKKLLVDTKTEEPLQWLSIYSDKDNSRRPLGLSMDLNSDKEIKDIADPRIKRLAGYRLNYVSDKIAAIDQSDLDKKEKDKLKAKVKSLKLFSNAIYEVRIETPKSQFRWVELKDLNLNDFDKISYAKPETTIQIKKKLAEYNLEELKKSYFENPVFVSERPIEVKKTRQKSYFQDLYEVTLGRYVYSQDAFMVYFFQEVDQKYEPDKPKPRVAKFLKFIDAVTIINADKPNKIDYAKLIDWEKSNEEAQNDIKYELMFTLAKHDLVYLSESKLTEIELKEINWDDRKSILPKLYIVKDINPSGRKVFFQQFYKADSISISEGDAKSLFNVESKNGLSEEIKYGTVDMLQRCIKVFTDRLGSKIVPYSSFPSGCWNKQRAKELGLIV